MRERAASPRTVDEYLRKLPAGQRVALQDLRTTIRAAAPEAEEVISYGMPAFRQNGMLVYFAAFHDHCSFFLGSPGVRERFAAELKPYALGKGTFRFTPERRIPKGLVRRIVLACVAENGARAAKRRTARRKR